MSINIAVITGKRVDPKTGFYTFYEQLVDYLCRNGYEATLHMISLEDKTEIHTDKKNYIYHILPNKQSFDKCENVDAIVNYINKEHINVVFNLLWPETPTIGFFSKLRKKMPTLMMVHLIHGRPDTVLRNKEVFVEENTVANVKGLKLKLQLLLPSIYLFLLKKLVSWRNYTYNKIHNYTILLSEAYVEDYIKTIDRKVLLSSIKAIPNPSPLITSSIPIQKKEKEIIYVGRLSHEKNIDKLIGVWKQLEEIYPEWKLTIVGDGPEKTALEDKARNEELKHVEFTGWIVPYERMDRVSILCLLSKFEGFPSVIMEAAQLGVVPICTDSFNAVRDMIADGKTGFIIPYLDLNEFESKLRYLMDNENKRIEMASLGCELVKRYNIENVGKKWLELLKEKID